MTSILRATLRSPPSEPSSEASPARISAAIASATCRNRSAGAAHRASRSRSTAPARAHRLDSHSLWRAITVAVAAAASTAVAAASAAGFLIAAVAFAPSLGLGGQRCHGTGVGRRSTDRSNETTVDEDLASLESRVSRRGSSFETGPGAFARKWTDLIFLINIVKFKII